MSLIFWGSNAIGKNDTALWGTGLTDLFASPQQSRLKQGHGWIWNSDSGFKSGLTCGTDNHYRVYHDSNPTKNIYWGYYIIGSAHQDKADLQYHGISICGSTARYGWQELAESNVAKKAMEVFGESAVSRNKVFLNNYVTPHWENNNWGSNNGKATKIHVCLSEFGTPVNCRSPDPPPISYN
jgi:hypothetical protein